jgi:hypothetical protein
MRSGLNEMSASRDRLDSLSPGKGSRATLAVSNKDVDRLSQIVDLEMLFLDDTSITDSGVVKLVQHLPRLREIGLTGTIVSRECKRNTRSSVGALAMKESKVS